MLPSAAGYEPTARPRRTPRRTSSATESQTYTVVLSAVARRAIERDLPGAVAVAVVDFLYGPLAADPYLVGMRLRFELQHYWSVCRGQPRVIHSTHEDAILVRVVRISHRSELYG